MTMAWTLTALVILLWSSHVVSSIRRASDNESPVAAYLVTVRRPDGLLVGGLLDEEVELWHTYLLGQVCNASDPATAERFPTAESRLICSYSHVVSGFSAWLTRQEVADMASRPWFVEAVPDKAYKLMSLHDDQRWLGSVRDGVWDKGNMAEGITIGVLKPKAGLLIDKAAFAVAPKAHLAIYPTAGMAAAVDDGVDVIVTSVPAAGTDEESYRAVGRGVVVCAPAGSSGPDMLQLESAAPWLLTVAASDTDGRVVTNVVLGSGILKPDVSAPGGIIAQQEDDDAQATSMAAAHVSGVAALLKKARRGWSPAAIKSALVTTADPAGPADGATAMSYLVAGAGEVNPVKAMDPGLVYDLTAGDLVPYLCGMRLGDDRTRDIVGASCAEAGEVAAKDLNYPSILIAMDDRVQQAEARRTVTNVAGDSAATETYRAEVTGAQGVAVAVTPSTMVFGDDAAPKTKRDFVVTVRRLASTPAKAVIEGELKWVSEKHAVRSPMVIVVGETTAASSAAYGAYAAASIRSIS
ncbi:unnamed protein product [Urochloa decumbens]|uniref:Uncharacterized protein n=1 Tax=Urochloa decumbens TaxID=240449 RepID=A0ABC9CGC9_9POAL